VIVDEAPLEQPSASPVPTAPTDPIMPGGRDRRLRYLLAAFAALVACTQIGAIIFPTLIKRSPAALLALSSRMRHLLFAVPADINPIAYAVIGFARLSLAAWVCYALGYFYGDRGVAWLERQVQGDTPATFRWLQRAADKGGPPLVFFMPGSNIVCVLVGQRKMHPHRFGLWLSLGIAFRLGWLWIAARLFDSELRTILNFIEKYQWWLVAAFFVISMLQGARKAAKNPPPSRRP
jgi:membrane protein DedA with SNARE-associated domain